MQIVIRFEARCYHFWPLDLSSKSLILKNHVILFVIRFKKIPNLTWQPHSPRYAAKLTALQQTPYAAVRGMRFGWEGMGEGKGRKEKGKGEGD